MILAIELFLSVFRIVILLLGVGFVSVFGIGFYATLNEFLRNFYLPCIEIISFLLVIVPMFAVIYGIHIQHLFWKRTLQFNVLIFLASFVAGVIIVLFPTSSSFKTSISGIYCAQSPNLLFDIMGTGLVVSVLGFVGVDIGVLLHHTSHHVYKRVSRKNTPKKKK